MREEPEEERPQRRGQQGVNGRAHKEQAAVRSYSPWDQQGSGDEEESCRTAGVETIGVIPDSVATAP